MFYFILPNYFGYFLLFSQIIGIMHSFFSHIGMLLPPILRTNIFFCRSYYFYYWAFVTNKQHYWYSINVNESEYVLTMHEINNIKVLIKAIKKHLILLFSHYCLHLAFTTKRNISMFCGESNFWTRPTLCRGTRELILFKIISFSKRKEGNGPDC